MATAAASQQAVKGLDLGTSRIVLATMNGQHVSFTPQLNAFVDIPYSKMTEQMLARENILHQVEGAHIFAYGNRSDEFAKYLNGDTRRPMQSGLLNPAEPKNLEMIELLLWAAVWGGQRGRETVPEHTERAARPRLRPHIPRAVGTRHHREAWLSGAVGQ